LGQNRGKKKKKWEGGEVGKKKESERSSRNTPELGERKRSRVKTQVKKVWAFYLKKKKEVPLQGKVVKNKCRKGGKGRKVTNRTLLTGKEGKKKKKGGKQKKVWCQLRSSLGEGERGGKGGERDGEARGEVLGRASGGAYPDLKKRPGGGGGKNGEKKANYFNKGRKEEKERWSIVSTTKNNFTKGGKAKRVRQKKIEIEPKIGKKEKEKKS